MFDVVCPLYGLNMNHSPQAYGLKACPQPAGGAILGSGRNLRRQDLAGGNRSLRVYFEGYVLLLVSSSCLTLLPD
jgi:hypothetical protein